MLEKMYAKNLMDSLFYLFISIRAMPTDPIPFLLLNKVQFWLGNDSEMNYRSILRFIKE